MKLPTKSRYSVHEAALYVSNAVNQEVRTDQILDWGAQGLFKLYLPMTSAQIRQGAHVNMLRDQTVEIRLSANEAALLGKGKRIYISKCWHDGVEGQFVRNVHGGYGGGYQADGLYFGSASIAVMGAELDIFIGGLFSTAAPLVQGATSAPGAEPAPPQTWQDAVRIIADELDAIDNQAGAWSSKADMSRRVAEIADKRGIKGAGSKKLTDGNILREALSGGAWRRKVIKKPKNGNSGESGEAREE